MNQQTDSTADNYTDKKATRKVSVAVIGAGTAGQTPFAKPEN